MYTDIICWWYKHIFTNSKLTNYNKDIHTVLKLVNKWFKGNFLSLNFEKTHYINFVTKNNPTINLKILCNNKLIPSALHTKFLGINIDSKLSWSTHIEQFISKLSTAFYVSRSIKPYMSHTILVSICYSHFHSIINNFLIFWWNSYSCKIFRYSELLRGAEVENFVGIYSRNQKFYHLSRSTYFLHAYFWLIIKISL